MRCLLLVITRGWHLILSIHERGRGRCHPVLPRLSPRSPERLRCHLLSYVVSAEPTPLTLAFYLTPELWLALLAGVVGAMPLVPTLGRWRQSLARPWSALAIDTVGTVALMTVLVAAIMQMAANTYNPFIYFRF